MLPVRNAIKGNKLSIRTQFFSRKCGRMVACESTLERDHLYHLEADPNVVSFQGQPFVEQYSFEGKIHTYIPDFAVDYQSPHHREIHEVKSRKEIDRTKVAAKYAAISQRFETMGITYRIVTDAEIRREPRLTNAALILRYRSWPEDQIPDVREMEINGLAVPLQAIADYRPWQSCLPLVADGILEIDRDQLLSGSSLARRLR